ncbi:g4388 [Coccomyxa elongata]
MNAEVAYAYRERKAEAEPLGEQAYNLRALQHLKLKTVVKESHCSPAHDLNFNLEDRQCSNLFATVGGNQATVYDDMHMGDYIAVVLNYVNTQTDHTKGGDLISCAWLNAGGCSDHPHGDAYLAVAGSCGDICIISIVEAKVVFLLKGHSAAVIDLVSCSARPGLLASLSKDGNVRVWDVPTETCMASFAADATALAFHPEGNLLVTGGRKGVLYTCHLPESCAGTMEFFGNSVAKKQKTGMQDSRRQVLEMDGEARHFEAIDCMRILPGNRLATKSGDGRMIVWDLAAKKQISCWKVPSCNSKGGYKEVCKFGSTSQGDYICAGNSIGDVRVYDVSSGRQVALVSPIKISAPVRACGLSEDCRHLVAVLGNGYIFRYEYRKPSSAEEASADESPAEESEED